MATWLSEYKNLKNEMEKQIGAGHASLEQLMLYQELLYRIEVLYASQAFCQTATAAQGASRPPGLRTGQILADADAIRIIGHWPVRLSRLHETADLALIMGG